MLTTANWMPEGNGSRECELWETTSSEVRTMGWWCLPTFGYTNFRRPYWHKLQINWWLADNSFLSRMFSDISPSIFSFPVSWNLPEPCAVRHPQTIKPPTWKRNSFGVISSSKHAVFNRRVQLWPHVTRLCSRCLSLGCPCLVQQRSPTSRRLPITGPFDSRPRPTQKKMNNLQYFSFLYLV